VRRRDPCTNAIPILLYSSNDEDSLRRLCLRHATSGYVRKGDPEHPRRMVATSLVVNRHLPEVHRPQPQPRHRERALGDRTGALAL
jgi:hypothetical protein